MAQENIPISEIEDTLSGFATNSNPKQDAFVTGESAYVYKDSNGNILYFKAGALYDSSGAFVSYVDQGKVLSTAGTTPDSGNQLVSKDYVDTTVAGVVSGGEDSGVGFENVKGVEVSIESSTPDDPYHSSTITVYLKFLEDMKVKFASGVVEFTAGEEMSYTITATDIPASESTYEDGMCIVYLKDNKTLYASQEWLSDPSVLISFAEFTGSGASKAITGFPLIYEDIHGYDIDLSTRNYLNTKGAWLDYGLDPLFEQSGGEEVGVDDGVYYNDDNRYEETWSNTIPWVVLGINSPGSNDILLFTAVTTDIRGTLYRDNGTPEWLRNHDTWYTEPAVWTAAVCPGVLYRGTSNKLYTRLLFPTTGAFDFANTSYNGIVKSVGVAIQEEYNIFDTALYDCINVAAFYLREGVGNGYGMYAINSIDRVELKNATWLTKEYVPSNTGLWDQTNNILTPITDPDQLQLGGGFSTGKLDITHSSTYDRVELTGLELPSQALVDANGIYNKIDDSKYKHETYDYWIIDTGWWWVITNDETNAWNGAMAEGSGGRPTPVDGAYYQGLNGYYGDILVNDTASGSGESITAYDKIYSRDVIKTSNSFQVGTAYSMGTNLDGENSVGIAEAPVNNISMKWIQDEGSGNSKDVMTLHSMGNLRLPDCDVSDITDDKDVITKEYLINNAPVAGLGDVLGVSNDANGNGISKLGWLQSEYWNTVDDGQFYLGVNGYQWKSGTGLHDVKFEHNYNATDDLLTLNYQTEGGTDKCVISMNGDGSASLPNCDVSDITDDNDIVTKEYLVTNYTEEAPQDGKYYSRKDGAWEDAIVGSINSSHLNMIPFMKFSNAYGDSIIEQGLNMLSYHTGNDDEETIDIGLKPSDLSNTSFISVRHILNRTLDGGTGIAGILATTDMTEFINHYSGAYITRDYADANYGGGGTNSQMLKYKFTKDGSITQVVIPYAETLNDSMGFVVPDDGASYEIVGLTVSTGITSTAQATSANIRISTYHIPSGNIYGVGGGTTIINQSVLVATSAEGTLYYRYDTVDYTSSPLSLNAGEMVFVEIDPQHWSIDDIIVELGVKRVGTL